jgi:hypothetical protein
MCGIFLGKGDYQITAEIAFRWSSCVLSKGYNRVVEKAEIALLNEVVI